MDVGNAIASAFAAIEQENAEVALRHRYHAALDVLRTIPSGTRDDELTDEQAAALDEYEHVARLLRGLDGQA